MIVEGNDTMNQTLEFNVMITNDNGGNVDRDIIVNISAIEISATGMCIQSLRLYCNIERVWSTLYCAAGLNDFILLNDSVTFPVNSRINDMEPFYVQILGDNFIEIDEMFSINISTVFPDIIGDPGSAIVTINRDGDSKPCAMINSKLALSYENT